MSIAPRASQRLGQAARGILGCVSKPRSEKRQDLRRRAHTETAELVVQPRRIRRDLLQVGRHINVDLTHSPKQASQDDLLKYVIGPHVLAVAHRRVKDAPFFLLTGPGGRVGRSLVHATLHVSGFLHQNHMQIIREVLR
jgi:hypothetical protein